jgi:hypothetical protein
VTAGQIADPRGLCGGKLESKRGGQIVGDQARRELGGCGCASLGDSSGAPVKASAIITVLDPPVAGIVHIKLTATTTAALAPGRHTDERQITLASKTSIVRGCRSLS